MMVTGDFELTAVSIAKNANTVSKEKVKSFEYLNPNYPIADFKTTLLSSRKFIHDAISIPCSNLEYMNENQWEHLTLFKEIVFPGQLQNTN